MVTPKPAIKYKEFYNKDRGLPEPKLGSIVPQSNCDYPLQCPTCCSANMYYSAHPDDPEEVFSNTVRCENCGHITDWFEAYKQRENNPTDALREVIRE